VIKFKQPDLQTTTSTTELSTIPTITTTTTTSTTDADTPDSLFIENPHSQLLLQPTSIPNITTITSNIPTTNTTITTTAPIQMDLFIPTSESEKFGSPLMISPSISSPEQPIFDYIHEEQEPALTNHRHIHHDNNTHDHTIESHKNRLRKQVKRMKTKNLLEYTDDLSSDNSSDSNNKIHTVEDNNFIANALLDSGNIEEFQNFAEFNELHIQDHNQGEAYDRFDEDFETDSDFEPMNGLGVPNKKMKRKKISIQGGNIRKKQRKELMED